MCKAPKTRTVGSPGPGERICGQWLAEQADHQIPRLCTMHLLRRQRRAPHRKGETAMKNKLTDLNNHLFAQLEVCPRSRSSKKPSARMPSLTYRTRSSATLSCSSRPSRSSPTMAIASRAT